MDGTVRRGRKKLRTVLTILAVLALGILAMAIGGPLLLKYPPGGSSFESNGVRIHYWEVGSGPPVILVHGLGVSGLLNWRIPGIARKLSKEFRVVIMDVRGHGRSSKPHNPERYGMEVVNDVIRLMDHLKIAKAQVVGYSMGGSIALRLVTAYPDRVQSVVMGGCGWLPRNEEDVRFLASLALHIGGRSVPEGIWRAVSPWGGSFQNRLDVLEKTMESFLNDGEAMKALAATFSALQTPEDALRANKVPICTIVGSRDTLKRTVDVLDGVLACRENHVIEGEDHTSTVFNPALASITREFLRRTSPEASR